MTSASCAHLLILLRKMPAPGKAKCAAGAPWFQPYGLPTILWRSAVGRTLHKTLRNRYRAPAIGGNEQSTHEYVSKLLGKQTIDTNTYGQSKGRSGSYTTNFQTAGRELMTPDEVRMLDNRYALLFIRGERPVKDLKYNILKHPNVALTTDGKAVAYQHGTDPLSVAAVSINLEKLKQAIPEDTDTGDYVVLTEEEVYDFMRKKAQENNQNQNSNKHQEVTYEKHHPQHHPSHHPSDF